MHMARSKGKQAALKLVEQAREPASKARTKLSPAPAHAARKVDAEPQNAEPRQTLEALEAVVDGKRVVIDAQDEVVIRCGKASITLRRNGRVVIRGTYVETRAEGVNRIKGGSVQIN
jgi:hypothetical protein